MKASDLLYYYKATLIRVLDGDSLLVDLHLGVEVSVRERIRMSGINAPELSTPEGVESRQWLVDKLPPTLFLRTEYTRAGTDRREKYGRLLAWVHLVDADGNVVEPCVNAEMVGAGKAMKIHDNNLLPRA